VGKLRYHNGRTRGGGKKGKRYGGGKSTKQVPTPTKRKSKISNTLRTQKDGARAIRNPIIFVF